MTEPISFAARNLVKRYGGVLALADGELAVQGGEALALLGANGSGKSTLSKIITGVVAPNEGSLTLDGQPLRFASPQAAQRRGIAAVYQELSLIPDMTVAENIWLGHEPLRWGVQVDSRTRRARTEALLALFSDTVRPSLRHDVPVARLSPDERQIVEILKALSLQPRLLILDEATASLDGRQVARLFELVERWKAEGRGIIFVSHRMDEIFQIADRAVVLRNGRTVGSTALADTTEQALVAMMVGEGAPSRPPAPPTAPVAAVERLRVRDLRTARLRGVSLTLQEGELLGLGGLQEQGQGELLRALFGDIPSRGAIVLEGQPVRFSHPRQAIRHGVAYVPGDRGREGLLLSRSILENFQLPSWRQYGFPLRMARAHADAASVADSLRLVRGSLAAPASSLSGGNAQKVVLGKWLLRAPRLLLLNDPTKGVDVGAKREFYYLLAELRQAGAAILFYSSDDEELLALCDRVLVLHDGAVSADLAGAALTHTALVAASMGSAGRSEGSMAR